MNQKNRKLSNQVAIITGAGAGIGKETALLLAQHGACVVVTDINTQSGAQTAKEIQKNGGQALFICHDVTKETDWINVVQQTKKTYGKIDILFNNAGIYIIKPITEITVEEWNKLMAINVTSVFLGMKHVMPVMAEQKKGSVINASSIAGIIGASGHLLYGASKGAIRTMTKDAAIEYARQGVRVNSIHPGYIKTDMVGYAEQITGKSEADIEVAYPLGRMGKPEEVAKSVLFLACDDASFITGTELVIDGGVTARA